MMLGALWVHLFNLNQARNYSSWELLLFRAKQMQDTNKSLENEY